MPVSTAAGTKLAIVSGAPATYDITGFAALSFVDVSDVVTLGEFGGSSQVVSFIGLTDVVEQKFKGSFNAGSMSINVGNDLTDAGQVVLSAGAKPTDNTIHSVKVTFPNTLVVYFTCIVTGFNLSVPDANSVISATGSLELNNEVIPGQ